jgi:hypothetical protein
MEIRPKTERSSSVDGATVFWLPGHPPPLGEESFHLVDQDGAEIIPSGGWAVWEARLNATLKPLGLCISDPEHLVQIYLVLQHCLLCKQRPGHWIGVFEPDHPALWGGPPLVPGKQRLFVYGICRRCWRRWPRKRLAQKVEEKILLGSQEGATLHSKLPAIAVR